MTSQNDQIELQINQLHQNLTEQELDMHKLEQNIDELELNMTSQNDQIELQINQLHHNLTEQELDIHKLEQNIDELDVSMDKVGDELIIMDQEIKYLTTDPNACEPDWSAYRKWCYYSSKYRTTYDGAVSFCKSRNSTMAYPRDVEEFSILRTLSFGYSYSNIYSYLFNIRRDPNNITNWINGEGESVTKLIQNWWAPGQPNTNSTLEIVDMRITFGGKPVETFYGYSLNLFYREWQGYFFCIKEQ